MSICINRVEKHIDTQDRYHYDTGSQEFTSVSLCMSVAKVEC